ncbi:MAG: alpha/beta fold hydrolase [Verrucomicrobiota bacterium]
MKKIASASAIYILKAILHGLVGGFIILVVFGILHLNNRPDLSVWHTEFLDEEFTRKSELTSFDEYLALEKRLFKQLDQLVYNQVPPDEENIINRFTRDSIADPDRWPRNWNHSFELAHDQPRAGVLLLHGLSDSPYSLRAIGETLNEAGAHVVGLRIPGHGTAPSGLVHTKWQDMAAAVELAMAHLKQKVNDQPIHLVGYSNGAALAVHYALDQIENPVLPQVDSIVLLSPEIAITPFAALAIWQQRVGAVLGLKKLAWTDILPEYDPYKYNSFPTNAGTLARRITIANHDRLVRLSKQNKLEAFPRLLTFQSAIDATVSAPAVVSVLYDHLPDNGHQLVVFDLNRFTAVEPLLKSDPLHEIYELLKKDDRTFTFHLLANKSEESKDLIVRTWPPGQAETVDADTDLQWPADVYSLTHISLPFRGDDPLYGGDNPLPSPGIQLGNMAFQGERGVLVVSAASLLRLRWNPFYSFVEPRILRHFRLDGPEAILQTPPAPPR